MARILLLRRSSSALSSTSTSPAERDEDQRRPIRQQSNGSVIVDETINNTQTNNTAYELATRATNAVRNLATTLKQQIHRQPKDDPNQELTKRLMNDETLWGEFCTELYRSGAATNVAAGEVLRRFMEARKEEIQNLPEYKEEEEEEEEDEMKTRRGAARRWLGTASSLTRSNKRRNRRTTQQQRRGSMFSLPQRRVTVTDGDELNRRASDNMLLPPRAVKTEDRKKPPVVGPFSHIRASMIRLSSEISKESKGNEISKENKGQRNQSETTIETYSSTMSDDDLCCEDEVMEGVATAAPTPFKVPLNGNLRRGSVLERLAKTGTGRRFSDLPRVGPNHERLAANRAISAPEFELSLSESLSSDGEEDDPWDPPSPPQFKIAMSPLIIPMKESMRLDESDNDEPVSDLLEDGHHPWNLSRRSRLKIPMKPSMRLNESDNDEPVSDLLEDGHHPRDPSRRSKLKLPMKQPMRTNEDNNNDEHEPWDPTSSSQLKITMSPITIPMKQPMRPCSPAASVASITNDTNSNGPGSDLLEDWSSSPVIHAEERTDHAELLEDWTIHCRARVSENVLANPELLLEDWSDQCCINVSENITTKPELLEDWSTYCRATVPENYDDNTGPELLEDWSTCHAVVAGS